MGRKGYAMYGVFKKTWGDFDIGLTEIVALADTPESARAEAQRLNDKRPKEDCFNPATNETNVEYVAGTKKIRHV